MTGPFSFTYFFLSTPFAFFHFIFILGGGAVFYFSLGDCICLLILFCFYFLLTYIWLLQILCGVFIGLIFCNPFFCELKLSGFTLDLFSLFIQV